MGEFAEQLSAVLLTARQLLRKHENICKHFVELRDKGAITDKIYAMLQSVEAELNRRKIGW